MASRNETGYERDFYAWAIHNAALIREGRFGELDAEHVAEEIEEMGRGIKRALDHRLAVLLAHLLKWEYQPAFRSRSWRLTIVEQRDAIADLLEENPSLAPTLAAVLAKAYRRAAKLAAAETELKPATFPGNCPWPLDQILDDEFWPE